MVYTLQRAQQSFKALVQIHEKSGKIPVLSLLVLVLLLLLLLLLLVKGNKLYVLELTVGFESNLRSIGIGNNVSTWNLSSA